MMKYTGKTLQLFFIILLISSCSTSKQARSYRKTVDGNWQLQTIVSEGITGQVKTQVFNEADFNCFVGSSWHFNSNNSLGTYTLSKNAGECVSLKRDIRWSIYEPKDQPKLFQFKRLDSKLKEVDGNDAGFRFTIMKIEDNSMQLKSEIYFDGKQAAFIYNFVRI